MGWAEERERENEIPWFPLNPYKRVGKKLPMSWIRCFQAFRRVGGRTVETWRKNDAPTREMSACLPFHRPFSRSRVSWGVSFFRFVAESRSEYQYVCAHEEEKGRGSQNERKREMVRKKKLSLFALVSSPPRSVFSVIGQDPTSSDLLISIQALMSSSRMIRKPQGTKEKENREAQANPDGSCSLLRSFLSSRLFCRCLGAVVPKSAYHMRLRKGEGR